MVQTFHRTKGRIPSFDIDKVSVTAGFQQRNQNERTVTTGAMDQGHLGRFQGGLGGQNIVQGVQKSLL
jgi:hypothetical protein